MSIPIDVASRVEIRLSKFENPKCVSKVRVPRFSILKLASGLLSRPIHINQYRAHRKYPNSTFKFISDTYRDYRALGKKNRRLSDFLQFSIYRRRRRINSMGDRSLSPPPGFENGGEIPSQSQSQTPLSRRQRILGFAKATRETYIPKITTSVARLATDASRAFNGSDLYDEQGRLIPPKDTTIQLFPSYTRQIDGKYYVDVKGWVSCPGLMTRKNRLILSLARQITRYNSNGNNSSQALSQWSSESLNHQDILSANENSDSESINSESSKLEDNLNPISSITTQSSINSEEILKERLACFIARSIPNTEVQIVIGSHKNIDGNNIIIKSVNTDDYGNFEATIEVTYTPSIVQVRSGMDESIFTFQEIMLVPTIGIGLISDIDDTIKLTGVIGDKRELMTNLLLNEVTSWNIPSVVKWYDDLFSSNNISFHYVSNSPWQLFTTIDQYFKAVKLPIGSVHLKQYSGNILSSLMEPSSTRKKRSLTRIINDFPQKKFICVGDSGEYDLEAYVELARLHPGKVIAIYIRYVKDSLSDIDDMKILSELRRLLTTSSSTRKALNLINPVTEPELQLQSENLIDLSSSSDDETPEDPQSKIDGNIKLKVPPIIPKKPTELKGNTLSPPLPSRNYIKRAQTDSQLIDHQTHLTEEPLPLPPRNNLVHANTEVPRHDFNLIDNLQNIYESPYFYELEEMDKKGANWIRKIVTALKDLEGTGTELKIFTDEESDFFNSKRIYDEIKNLKV
ncbi:uncharacterized protein RJT21DRAFT_133103 [Scheffersomyces amazonensis]|uniref:uncharacterized protein n=1 Tax=Scheffersomyces amazonensis TaxID=1078765 RepID=UPI00315D34EE